MSGKSWFFRIVEFSFIPTLSSLCYWMLCIHPTWMISCFTWRSESGLECQPLAEPQNRSLAGRIGHLGQRKGVQVIRCYDCNCSSLVGTGQWVWLQVQFRRKDVNCRKMDAGNNLSQKFKVLRFPGGLVVKTPCCHCRRYRFHLLWENKDPTYQAVQQKT